MYNGQVLSMLLGGHHLELETTGRDSMGGRGKLVGSVIGFWS